MENLNFLAIGSCAILNLVLGGIWYSPVSFKKTWREENNLTEEKMKDLKSTVIVANLALFEMKS